MRIMNWKCDGCGKTLDSAPDGTPDGWTQARVTIQGMENLDFNRTFELCSTCQFKLHSKAQPDKWEGKNDAVAATTAFDLHSMPLFEFPLPRRVKRILADHGAKTVADLASLSRKDLMRTYNFGARSWKDLKELVLDPLHVEMQP